MREVVIVSGARTAVGNFMGTLKDIPAAQLGAICIRESLKKAGLKPKAVQSMLDTAPDPLKGSGIIAPVYVNLTVSNKNALALNCFKVR